LKDYLKTAGIYDYFEVVFGGSVREKGQKHIEVFDMVLEDQNFANRTVYVGDSEFDREIAKEAGISFVKVGKEEKDYYEINNISEFEDYIDKVK
ncbi:MAG: HAD hydrolase-like protein, partial [Candidatus Gracilibacteria bacterium]|nr:HAD hydrolase-like protein [Candidatus Gracilibacteria bacterium]